VLERLAMVEQKIDIIGLQRGRENIIAFFKMFDEVWGIPCGLQKKNAPHLLNGWIMTVAQILSDHHEFWKQSEETELFVPAAYIRDFKKIDPSDPELKRLAGSNQTGRQILYQHLVARLNKGMREYRLVDRYARRAREEAA
jgi:hypothetical protein